MLSSVKKPSTFFFSVIHSINLYNREVTAPKASCPILQNLEFCHTHKVSFHTRKLTQRVFIIPLLRVYFFCLPAKSHRFNISYAQKASLGIIILIIRVHHWESQQLYSAGNVIATGTSRIFYL